jgi:RimJ/RimL family protein N-acetyltransferase
VPTTPQFISERISPEPGSFDIGAMSRGEPGLPKAFSWRGQRFEVAQITSTHRGMGEDRGDVYVRRHYYEVETTDALRMSLYFERNPSDRSRGKAWWLFTLAFPNPVIKTPRLHLRRWTNADRDSFRRMVADPDVMRHLHDFAPMSVAQADRALADTLEHYKVGYGDWAIVEPSSGDIMGESGLTPVEGGEVEIGWMLFQQFWGRGYAFEAANAVKEYALDSLRLSRLVAFVRPDNERSKRLAEKLGLRPIGTITNSRGHEMLKFELHAT